MVLGCLLRLGMQGLSNKLESTFLMYELPEIKVPGPRNLTSNQHFRCTLDDLKTETWAVTNYLVILSKQIKWSHNIEDTKQALAIKVGKSPKI